MGRPFHHIQTNFTAGELAPAMKARVDIARYPNGCQVLENCEVLKIGGVRKRSGSRFIAEAKFHSRATRLVPFAYSITQTYILEFGHLYIRFYRDRDQLMDDGTLKSAGSSTTPLEIVTTYQDDELADLKFTQSADVLFICHPDHAPMELQRASDVSWSLVAYDYKDGPYDGLNEETTTLTPSAVTGDGITITASSTTGINGGSGFTSDDVGRLIRVRGISGAGGGGGNITRISTADSGNKTRITTIEDHGLRNGERVEIIGTVSYDGVWKIIRKSKTTFLIGTAFVTANGDEATDVNEVQSITVDATGGTFTVTFEGDTTAALAFDITAGDLETALEGLTDITSVTVTGGPGDSGGTSPYVITFDGADAGSDQSAFTTDAALLTGGAGTAGVVETTKGRNGSGARWFRAGTEVDANNTTLSDQQLDIWGYAKIVSVGSTTVVTADIKSRIHGTGSTTQWRLGSWYGGNWPRVPLFHTGRLWFFGNVADPSAQWGSIVDDIDNHAPTELDGAVLDDSAINRSIRDNQVNSINFATSTEKGILVHTDSGNFLTKSRSASEPITPTSLSTERQDSIGCSATVPPLRINESVMMVQRDGQRVHQVAFDFDLDQFVAPDLTILADHIFDSPATGSAWQAQPNGTAWWITKYGTLVALSYDREQEITAWCRHILGGSVLRSQGAGNHGFAPFPALTDGTISDAVDAVFYDVAGVNGVREVFKNNDGNLVICCDTTGTGTDNVYIVNPDGTLINSENIGGTSNSKIRHGVQDASDQYYFTTADSTGNSEIIKTDANLVELASYGANGNSAVSLFLDSTRDILYYTAGPNFEDGAGNPTTVGAINRTAFTNNWGLDNNHPGSDANQAMVHDPGTDFLYVTTTRNAVMTPANVSIFRIDVTSPTLSGIATYDTGGDLIDVQLLPDGNIIACGRRAGSKSVWVLSPDLATLHSSVDTGADAWRLTYAPWGNVLVVGQHISNVQYVHEYSYSTSTKALTLVASHAMTSPGSTSQQLQGMAFGNDNIAYIGDQQTISTPEPAIAYKWFPVQTGFVFQNNQNDIVDDSYISSIATITNEPHDQLWFTVTRTINSTRKQYIEFFEDVFETDPHVATTVPRHPFFLDSGITVTSTIAFTAVSGLDHLEGETVQIVGDSAVQASKTVASGAITLDRAVTVAHIGLGYTANIVTMPFVPAGLPTGAAAQTNATASEVTLRVEDTSGLKLGQYGQTLHRIPWRKPSDPMDQAVSPRTEQVITNITSAPDREFAFHVRHDDPMPCTLLNLTAKLDMGHD